MSLNLKNEEVVRLAGEVASMAGETKTEAIRKALEERRARLQLRSPRKNMQAYMERYIWPFVPPEVLGKAITKEEREQILGFAPEGF
ncbi:MAG TPA: type II toxin-antitoxin system VapB family antitoxin [Bryobacteraceae bacterium]|nr:type II toxin-antitoxin system VapB family antitoxin [Bryobacteraceae bacterium]